MVTLKEKAPGVGGGQDGERRAPVASQSGDPRRFRSSRLWVAPVVGVAVASATAAAALAVDHVVAWDAPPLPLFSGDADTVRTMLSVIAMAVTTLLALVFTIIAVIIQLASSQYSPRALRTLLKDRPTQFTIGVFVGTITYALILLLALRVPVGDDPDTAAGLAPTLAFAFAVVSIATFAVYSNHISHAVRISSIVNRIAEETRAVIDQLYPEPFHGGDDGSRAAPVHRHPAVVRAEHAGVLLAIDEKRLCELARTRDVVLRLVPKLGDYVPEGGPLFEVDGGDVGAGDGARELLELKEERELERDPAWGIRMLVDIAIRALSPGVNDPTTAAQVVDRVGDLLGRLVRRAYPPPVRTDRDGRARLVVPAPTWEEFLALGVDEIRIHGADDLHVVQRLLATLEFLLEVAPETRRPPIEERLRLLRASVEDSFDAQRDRRAAADPERQRL